MFQERHRLGGCGHSRAQDAPGCALHRRRAVDSPPRLRAKSVGFVAALQVAASRASTGAAGGLGVMKMVRDGAFCSVLDERQGAAVEK